MAKDKILKPFVGIIAPENKFTVDTIDDLKNKNYLTISDIVDILGYYSKGDRGAHKRIIESTSKVGGIQLANGLWANVQTLDVIYVEWFGLKEGVSNASIYFNLAGEFIYREFNYSGKEPDARRKQLIKPVLKCMPGHYYTCLDTIKLSNRRKYDFGGCLLDFNDSQASVGIEMTGHYDESDTGWWNGGGPLTNVYVKGLTNFYDGYFNDTVDFHKENYMYKKGFTGVMCKGGTELQSVTAQACEIGIDMSWRDTFLINITNVGASFCKYGFSMTSMENSNENMKFSDCVIGNNWSAFKCVGTGAFFYNCSIDYNWMMCDPEIPWETGFVGTPNGILSFDQCWIEDTKSNVEVYFPTKQSQVRFDNCYFILPKKDFFLKAEHPDDLITFNDCLFGDSGPIATDDTRLLMRGTTYHKLWSTKGGGKFRKRDNQLRNGYMTVEPATDPITPDGNKIYGWNMKQGSTNPSGATFSTLEYFTDTDGKRKVKMKNGKYRGCQLWTSKFLIRNGDFLTILAQSDSQFCEVWFYDGDDQIIEKEYLARVSGVRYRKLGPVPQGTVSADVIFANSYGGGSAEDEMVVEYCEVNIVY